MSQMRRRAGSPRPGSRPPRNRSRRPSSLNSCRLSSLPFPCHSDHLCPSPNKIFYHQSMNHDSEANLRPNPRCWVLCDRTLTRRTRYSPPRSTVCSFVSSQSPSRHGPDLRRPGRVGVRSDTGDTTLPVGNKRSRFLVRGPPSASSLWEDLVEPLPVEVRVEERP